MKFCALIPAYNEEKNIPYIIRVLKGKGLDVLVIDDGSEDNTYQVSLKEKAIALRNQKNKGKGYAITKGLNYIKDKGYEAVILLDADGQHDPCEVDRFIETFKGGFDLVIGNRMHNSKGMPFVRFVTNKFMSFLISLLIGYKINDSQSGFRLLSSRLIKRFNLKSQHFEVESEMILEATKNKARIKEIPIKSIYKRGLSRINPLLDTYRFLKFLVRILKI